jgi:hypothetical protein
MMGFIVGREAVPLPGTDPQVPLLAAAIRSGGHVVISFW